MEIFANNIKNSRVFQMLVNYCSASSTKGCRQIAVSSCHQEKKKKVQLSKLQQYITMQLRELLAN